MKLRKHEVAKIMYLLGTTQREYIPGEEQTAAYLKAMGDTLDYCTKIERELTKQHGGSFRLREYSDVGIVEYTHKDADRILAHCVIDTEGIHDYNAWMA